LPAKVDPLQALHATIKFLREDSGETLQAMSIQLVCQHHKPDKRESQSHKISSSLLLTLSSKFETSPGEEHQGTPNATPSRTPFKDAKHQNKK
jgi:hypothetical protein